MSEIIKKVAILGGDLSGLTPKERGDYYVEVCDSVGVNPLTEPFKYITLNGKLQLYATRACAEQLRKVHSISLSLSEGQMINDAYVVKAKASMPNGRCDESTGAVNLAGLKGEAFSNALLKAETKAKRRVTLSICGLGYLDETEVEDIPGAVLPAESSKTPETQGPKDPTDPPKDNPPKGAESPAVPSKEEKPPATKPQKERDKKKDSTYFTVAVMEDPAKIEGGYELTVLVVEPQAVAETQGPLTLISPTAYEQGQALQVAGSIEGNKIVADKIAPVAETKQEAVTLLSELKAGTFKINGQEKKLLWAHAEARGSKEGFAVIGECLKPFKKGDTLEVVVSHEDPREAGTRLYLESAIKAEQVAG